MTAIIPARFSSTRLPGKMLLDICGKPLILHTLGQAVTARTVARVIIATDDQRIFDAVTAAGGEARMTSAEHESGSDRVAEVAESLPHGSVILNVQGDEPLILPETIDRAVEALANDENADVVTTSEAIDSAEDLFNPNIVKVVTNSQGHALYFSRSPVPYPRDAALRHGASLKESVDREPDILSIFRKHTGLYVYSREFLLEFTRSPRSGLEEIEMLEQLRALENGAVIKVVPAAAKSIGVDTQEDLEKVRKILSGRV